ncbi:MAG TPA: NACHT domain-containing protein, partial [Lamprocystis sp. (in: g-proteobacteria)]|nr:NACHT domain-containing protein [Lamprocystis sp. (in: g-proteobacteria)]
MLTKLSEARTRHLVIVGGLLTFHLGGILLTLSVLGLLTLGTVLIAWFYRPQWWGSTRVQAIAILVFGGLVMTTFADTFWLPWVTDLYAGLRGRFSDLPALSLPNSVPYWVRLAALALAALVFILVNRLTARRPVLPPPDLTPDRPFPEKGYETLRDEFCTYMRGQLDQYDTELNWSDSDYSTLEAEVEADRHGVRRPRVERDLVDAIRRDRETRAFLLLGDPGSGKSVSLRRLCRRLYAEVPDTGIVPVYVNLRDWHGTAEPGDEEIQAFIREYLKRSAGRAGKRFLDTWFEPMLADGRFFFLLDSFDEMPSVLDCDDADSRIKTISHAFDRFFHDLHGCRGVLASRRFRQPRGFRGRRLSIRPFKESQIRAAMRRWLQGQALDPDQLVRTLFRERPELVPALRNPFLADLIAHYLIQHQGALPPSHFAIYQDYLETRLAEDAPDLRAHGLNQDAVMDAATRIAWTMYANPDVGLEVDKRELSALVQMEPLDDLIEALRMARIVRVGGIRAQRLSFVHRRFAEFYVVRAMLATDDPLPIDSIPEDSRWRDCLALYCGVAPSERVQPIADYCWAYIETQDHVLDSGNAAQSRPLIHCLRFLRDGFLSRPECLAAFRAPLSARILEWIAGDNPLAAKTASEALGLLEAPCRSQGVRLAFENGGIWIKESALLACRHLGGLDDAAQQAIRAHIRTLPSPELVGTFRDLDFGLSLSDDMRTQRHLLHLDALSLILLWFVVPPLF